MKPTFIVIGGMKCGTSALYKYLSQQKGVYLPSKKNIEYFCDENWLKSRNWYESFFPMGENNATVIGEISTEYAKFPKRCNIPKRIAEVVPDIRLIYLVRHPVKRMISHYIHSVGNLSESRPIELALRPNVQNHYVNFSCYYMQLEQYFPYFSRDKIKIIKSECLLERPQETIEKIFDFVGADGVLPVENQIVHSRKEKRSWNKIGRVIRRSPELFNLFTYYKKKVPSIISELMMDAVSRPINIEKLPTELHSSILEYIKDDVNKLYSFAGDEISKWDLEEI